MVFLRRGQVVVEKVTRTILHSREATGFEYLSLKKKITYGIVTGKSGPSNFEPSQKQSSGVMMAQGKMFSKI